MTKERQFNYAYALELLKKINNLELDGKKLSKSFFYEDYNLWQIQQQSLYNACKFFSKTGSADHLNPGIKSFKIFAKDLILGLFLTLVSFLAWLKILIFRPEVIVFSVDKINSKHKSDKRIEEVYNFLGKHGVTYTEFFHAFLGRTFLGNLLKRKRIAFYDEAASLTFSIFSPFFCSKAKANRVANSISLDTFNEQERYFVKKVLKEFLRAVEVSKFKIKFFKFILSGCTAKALLAIDDTRYSFEIILAAKLNGIRALSFQHGQFSKYHVGWLLPGDFSGRIITPDKIYVWSQYWKDELLRLGTYFKPEQIIVGGIKKTPKSLAKRKKQEQELNVLVPYETNAPKSEIGKYFKAILSCPGVKIYFKLRSDVSVVNQLKNVGLSENFHENFITNTDVEEIIDKIDLVAGTHSTFLTDMLSAGKPLAYLKTSLDYGEGIVINGLADVIDLEKGNICNQLNRAALIGNQELQSRVDKLIGVNPRKLEETLDELGQELKLI